MAKVKPEEEIKIPDAEPTEKPPEGYTDEEWKDLSPTEREGVLDKGEEDEEGEGKETLSEEQLEKIAVEGKTAEQKAAEDAKKEKDDKEAIASQLKADAEAAKVAGKTVEEIQAEQTAAEATRKKEEEAKLKPGGPLPTDEELLQFRPVVLESELPALPKMTVGEMPESLKVRLAEIEKKFTDGDLSDSQRLEEREKIRDEVYIARIEERDKALLKRESDRGDLLWQKEQGHFLRSRPEYLEKSLKGNAFFGALGQAVKTLGEDPKFAGVSGIQLLIEADKAVKEAFGMTKVPAKEPEKKPPAPLPKGKTLTDVPNAAANLVEGAWTSLDKLTGEAYEAALERMTPEQRDRYLAAR